MSDGEPATPGVQFTLIENPERLRVKFISFPVSVPYRAFGSRGTPLYAGSFDLAPHWTHLRSQQL
jgi:hypothetical protein